MEHLAAIGMAVVLSLICLFWVYGYVRRRTKKRY
jgi:hypothetical protein